MRFLTTLSCAALGAAILSLVPLALAAAPTPVISKGTPIRLSLQTPLRSGQAKIGDRVLFTVTQPVDGPDQTLLVAQGAPAVGHVTESDPKGSFGQNGKLIFTCDSVRGADGTQIPLHLVIEADSPSGALADAADRTEAQQFHAFTPEGFDPDGYVQSAQPGGYYFQQNGTSSSRIYNPGRFFGSADAVVKQGQKFKATVESDTPLDAASY